MQDVPALSRAQLMPLKTRKPRHREQQRRRAYSPREMAEIIGVSDATASRMIRNGIVGSIKVGHRRLIPDSEIERLLTVAAA
jgi:excisionase family DNA binding protein